MADTARQMTLVDSNDEPALIVFHKDGNEPARGSWFPSTELDAALKGAKTMGLDSVKVGNAEMQALANRIPKGRVFERSGKLFLPRIQSTVFDALSAQAPKQTKRPVFEVVRSSDGKQDTGEKENPTSPSTSTIIGTPPSDWSKFGVGSLVLARDIEEEDEAFYLAVIHGKVNPTTYTLKWRDYPDIDPITRNVKELAMLHPGVELSELEWEGE